MSSPIHTGAGKLRYNRALTPFPESNAAYVHLKDISTKLGTLEAYAVAAHDGPLSASGTAPAVIRADSLAYFLPKHNYVAGMSLQQQLTKGLKIQINTALSHTRMLDHADGNAFKGIGQQYGGNVHWTQGRSNFVLNGRHTSANFFSTANPYLQAGLNQAFFKYIQQIKKTTQLHLDAAALQVRNNNRQAEVWQVGTSIMRQFKKGYSATLGIRNQESVLSSSIAQPDSADGTQRLTTLDARATGTLTPWLNLELNAGVLNVSGTEGYANRQSLQQTYGGSIGIRPTASVQCKLGFGSTYVTQAELITGPRMPSGRMYRTHFSTQATIKRVVCTANGLLNMGQQDYRTLYAQVKLSYVFSKYLTGNVRYLHQLLSGPYEQYNYFNEQVGFGVVGSL